MKTALLVDTNRSAAPLYYALVNRGLRVSVVGSNPKDYLAKVSPNYVNLDYSNQGLLADLIRERRFDYIIPGCNDLSYEMCAAVGNGTYPGIDSLATTLILNHKAQFRQFAHSIGLCAPQVLEEGKSSSTGRIIVKPADAFSGRGMKVLDQASTSEIRHALQEARNCSRTTTAIIEEFVDGQLMSHSAFIRDQKVVVDFIVHEDCTAHPFAVDSSHLVATPDQHLVAALRVDAEKIAYELKLTDGLLHTQFITNGFQHWIIEVTRRCPGDLYSQLIEFSTGSPYSDWYLKPFLGETVEPLYQNQGTRNIIRHTVSPTEALRYAGLQFHDSLNIPLFVSLAGPGDLLRAAPYGRAAILFLEEQNKDSMNNLYQQTIKRDLYSFLI